MGANLGLFTGANLSQQLNLAPQLLNWLNLLQVSTLDLNTLVRHELESNPALEEELPAGDETGDEIPDEVSAEDLQADPQEIRLDDGTMNDRFSMLADMDDEWRTADAPRLANTDQLQEKHDFMMDHLVKGVSLQDELDQAITYSDLSGEDANLAREMAGYIDERGYFSASLDDFAEHCSISRDRAWSVLLKFQNAVPPGIGARDLRECLILQLAALRCDTRLAERLVNEFLDMLAQTPAKVAEQLGVSAEELDAALNMIRLLDPEPGRLYQQVPVEYVAADLEITVEEGMLQVELCSPHMPTLQLSQYCKRLLESKQGSKTDLDYIRQKLRDAEFLIQGISQRQETMLKVARQIMRVQKEFLSTPEGQLEPLTMNKVAAIIGVHETTVSRAVANKFVRIPRGLIEMRAFFKTGYRCADGSSVTPERVKERLAGLIDAELSRTPLTDAQLAEQFKAQGIRLARRTIAKYREEMGILSSKERGKCVGISLTKTDFFPA
jgi:RNA polymerase sigma-54 factor